jgi:type IV pilus assembly protein PilM
MAFQLSKNTIRGSVGLDIDGDYLAAVQLAHGKVSRAASMDLPAGIVADGEVVDGARLTEALKEFFKRESLPRHVRLGVANQQIVVRHLELPRIENADELRQAVAFQAQEAIPMPLDEVVLDHQVVGGHTASDGSWRMRVVVVAARTTMVQAVIDAARAAGLRPEGIDLDAFAMVRTLARSDQGEDAATVFCHLSGIANLAIGVGPNCLFSRPLAVDLSDEGDGALELADEIRPSIDAYLTLPEVPPVTRVLFAGPGAAREGLAEQVGALLDLPVELAAPLGSLPGEVPGDPRRQTLAAGLALGATA